VGWMPFTALHIGPALLVALLVYPLLDTPTMLVASIVIDLEPLLVILLSLPQPLHGPYHSLTVSTPVGVSVAVAMYLMRGFTSRYVERLGLPQGDDVRGYLAASLIGVWGHVLLDSFLYSEMSLIYPWQWNPLLGLMSYGTIFNVCLISFPLAVIVYLLRVTLMAWVRNGNPLDAAPTEEEPMLEPLIEPGVETDGHEEAPFLFFDIPESADEQVYEEETYTSAAIQAEPETGPLVRIEIQPDIFLGCDRLPEQWGLVGKASGKLVAVDLNEPHIVFVCGKQGSGKGYTIGVVSEMLLSKSIQGISQVRKPATIIVFHKPRDDIRSEFWSIVDANRNPEEAAALREGYGVEPRRVIERRGFRIFVDPFVYKNERRKFEDDYDTKVYPIGINPTRLTAEDWPHVLSLGKKSGSMYVKKIFQIIKKTQYDKDFGLNTIRREVEASDLNPNQKGFAMMRLETLEDYLVAGDFMNDLIIGGVNVFDLRKIMMEPDDVFSVMILVISSLINNENTAREQFVFVINEAHDYLRKGLSKDFTDYINYLIRKKRHAGTWLMLDTHFPEDVDPKIIKGSDIKIFHKSDVISSNLLRQVVEGTPTPPHQLNTGEAIIRADKSNLGPDRVMIVNVRPRLTHHGAATKTAV
jgi:membrane-bound metal-dependent hydrolase YbcI (DUF457 family)